MKNNGAVLPGPKKMMAQTITEPDPRSMVRIYVVPSRREEDLPMAGYRLGYIYMEAHD